MRKKATLPPTLQRLMPRRGQEAARQVANDRILWVEGIPKDFPCKQAAMFCVHAAQDGGYGKICIVKGLRHKHTFKVLDLVRDTQKRKPKENPWSGPSLKSFQLNSDCFYDKRKQIWVLGPAPKPEARLVTGA